MREQQEAIPSFLLILTRKVLKENIFLAVLLTTKMLLSTGGFGIVPALAGHGQKK